MLGLFTIVCEFDGLKGVWCFTASVGKKPVLGNVVASA